MPGGRLGVGEWHDRGWCFARPARLLLDGERLLGVAQQLGRDEMGAFAPTYVDRTDRHVAAEVELFSISKQALLASAVATPA